MTADTGQADGSAPATQPAALTGTASALARLESWHHDVIEGGDGWGWIRTLDHTRAARRAPGRVRYQDTPVLELMHGGRWLGHPLPPALSDLPIGLWAGSLILDLTDRDPASRPGVEPAAPFS